MIRWAALLLTVSCSPNVVGRGTPATVPAPATTPGKRPRVFTTLPTVTFKPGAALKKKRIGVQRTWAGTTPDGATSVFGFDMKGWLQTPKGTFPFPAAHVARTVWSDDRSRVAVLQYLGPAVVLDTLNGANVLQRKGALECDARFGGNDTLYVHEESKDATARLYRVDLKSGASTALSAPRRVDQCAASADARTWVLFDEYAKDSKLTVLDAPSGKLEPLAHGDLDAVTLSPAGDRACFVRGVAVVCARTDHVEERIAHGLHGVGLEIDPLGARMLVQAFYDLKDESVPVMLLVDFAGGTVREVRGPTLKSGGSVHLMSSGKVIATGSASGVEAFDVESGTRHTVLHPEMYSVHAVAGAERSIIGEEDNGGDTYWIVLP